MRWAVLLVMAGCGRGSPPGAAEPARSARPDPLARGWYLKARVSEGRGQIDAAERAFDWVGRLDPGPWADIERGEFYRRAGRTTEARQAFEAALAARPGMPEATLGLGLTMASTDPEQSTLLLAPLVPLHPCRIATSGPPGLRESAEVACRGR